jgi:two-component system chemotaxis response regulator CheB
MPASALRYVPVDEVLPLAEVAPAIVRLAHEVAPGKGGAAVSDDIDLEAGVSEGRPGALEDADTLGVAVPFSCPDCGGVLVEYYDGDLLRFRCQVGHVFSRESMFSNHATLNDRSLWAAYAALDERVNLAHRLARDAERLGDARGAQRFQRLADEAEQRREQVRLALLKADEGEELRDVG